MWTSNPLIYKGGKLIAIKAINDNQIFSFFPLAVSLHSSIYYSKISIAYKITTHSYSKKEWWLCRDDLAWQDLEFVWYPSIENNIYLFGVKLLHLSSSAFLISLIQLDNKWLNIFLFRHTHCAIWRHLSSSSLSIFRLRLFYKQLIFLNNK